MKDPFKKKLDQLLKHFKKAVVDTSKKPELYSTNVENLKNETQDELKKLKALHESISIHNPDMQTEHLSMLKSSLDTLKELALETVRAEAYRLACEKHEPMKIMLQTQISPSNTNITNIVQTNEVKTPQKKKVKPYEQPMTKEFRKLYLEEVIKFIDEGFHDAQHNLKASERYFNEVENATRNLDQKIALINNLPRRPSEKAYKQMEFLKSFIPKLHDKKARDYREYKQQAFVIPQIHDEELMKCREELARLNNELDKT